MAFSPILLPAHNPGPMTGRGNNTFLIVGPSDRGVLIDAGVGDARHLAALNDALAARGAVLDRVLVTHGHPDHASGAPALAAAHQVALFKWPSPEHDARTGLPWRPLADRQSIALDDETLTVVHTPGHAPDHVVFWHEASGTVFAGDLVIPRRSVMVSWSHGGNMSHYLASLERVRALDARRLLPGHGPAVDDPRRILTEQLEHRLQRERQVLAALEAGLGSVQAIADSIYDRLEPALAEPARQTVRAHLEKLKDEGRALDEDGRWRREGAR